MISKNGIILKTSVLSLFESYIKTASGVLILANSIRNISKLSLVIC